jgi:clan AA aspartic protease (TIGR02281 family)
MSKMYEYQLNLYDPSTINTIFRDKLMTIGRWQDKQNRILVTYLYNGQMTYSEFAKAQATMNERFLTAEHLIDNNMALTAQQAIDKASAQVAIPDIELTDVSTERPCLHERNEVRLQNHNGTYTLPARVNGAITIDFVLDTGASDVLIPEDVFKALIRTSTITAKDIIGQNVYTIADGSRVTTYSFFLRDLKVGGNVINNVVASVGPEASTPLLGQSFLSKFKSWTLDNARHVLVIQVKG